jgi:hypothetical protein
MKKIFLISLVLLTLNLLTGTEVLAAAQRQQTGTLEINPGNELTLLQEPDDFSFPTSFLPHTPGSINIYKTLDPGVPGKILQVGDNTAAAGFSITASISDFTSQHGDRIHFDKVGMVTLHQSRTEQADGLPINIPPGAPNVTAPDQCSWNPSGTATMESVCDESMFTFIGPAGATVSDEVSIMDNANATDTGNYSIGFGLRLNMDSNIQPDNYSSVITFTLMPL